MENVKHSVTGCQTLSKSLSAQQKDTCVTSVTTQDVTQRVTLGAGGSQAPVGPDEANHGPQARPQGAKRGPARPRSTVNHGPARPRSTVNHGPRRPQGAALGAGGSQAPVGPDEANHGPQARPQGAKRGPARRPDAWLQAWKWKDVGPVVPEALCRMGKPGLIELFGKLQYRRGRHSIRLTFDECAAMGIAPSTARANMALLVEHGFAERLNTYEYRLVYQSRYVSLPAGAQRASGYAMAALATFIWHGGGVGRARGGLLSFSRSMKQLAAWLGVHRDTLRRWYQQIDGRMFKRTPRSYAVKDRWDRWIRRQTYNRFTVCMDTSRLSLDSTAARAPIPTEGQGSGPESTGRERTAGPGQPVDNQGHIQGTLDLMGMMMKAVARHRAKAAPAPG